MTDKKKLLEAEKLLQDYCKSHEQTDTKCEGCIFFKNGCHIWNKPRHWNLPYIKTNGDILLEKYPKTRQDSDGRIYVCPDALGLIDCDGTDCVKCQNDYWNAPVESEEENDNSTNE